MGREQSKSLVEPRFDQYVTEADGITRERPTK